MEHIVVGYDGGLAADSAIRWVALRSRTRSTRVTIVTVDDALHPAIEMHSRMHAGRDLLSELNPHVEILTEVIKGHPAHVLPDESSAADLLVVGVYAEARVRTALLGYMAVRLAARAVTPVVFVPEGWTPVGGPVVVGYDADGSSDAALAFALKEAGAEACALHIVHVWDGLEDDHQLHGAVLDRAAEQARKSAPSVSAQPVLVTGVAPSALTHESVGASLLVIGGHHRGVWLGGLLGAVSWSLIGSVKVPVCVVSPVESGIKDDIAEADSMRSRR